MEAQSFTHLNKLICGAAHGARKKVAIAISLLKLFHSDEAISAGYCIKGIAGRLTMTSRPMAAPSSNLYIWCKDALCTNVSGLFVNATLFPSQVQLLKKCPSKRPTNFEQLDYGQHEEYCMLKR